MGKGNTYDVKLAKTKAEITLLLAYVIPEILILSILKYLLKTNHSDIPSTHSIKEEIQIQELISFIVQDS
jgi:hypothetical protein